MEPLPLDRLVHDPFGHHWWSQSVCGCGELSDRLNFASGFVLPSVLHEQTVELERARKDYGGLLAFGQHCIVRDLRVLQGRWLQRVHALRKVLQGRIGGVGRVDRWHCLLIEEKPSRIFNHAAQAFAQVACVVLEQNEVETVDHAASFLLDLAVGATAEKPNVRMQQGAVDLGFPAEQLLGLLLVHDLESHLVLWVVQCTAQVDFASFALANLAEHLVLLVEDRVR